MPVSASRMRRSDLIVAFARRCDGSPAEIDSLSRLAVFTEDAQNEVFVELLGVGVP